MGYKSIDEMIISFRHLANYFKEEKSNFSVHKDYLLDNMTEEEFNRGYEDYRRLMFALQNDMCEKPEEYGLIKYDKNNTPKPAYINNYPYLWIFLATAQAGEIKDDILYVNGKKFKEFEKGKLVGSHSAVPADISKLFTMLETQGVFVKGYENGKSNDFTVSSEIPRLMSVIKSSTLSQYAKKSMMSDYVTFNEKLYAIGKNEQIKFENTYTYKIMPENLQKFSSELINELAKTGWRSYVERHHEPEGGRLTYPGLEYYYNTKPGVWKYGGTWVTIKNKSDFLKHIDYIESIPEKYREIWESSLKCRGCRKGECSQRHIGTILGKKGVRCLTAGVTYPLNYCTIEAVPYIVEAARLMAIK